MGQILNFGGGSPQNIDQTAQLLGFGASAGTGTTLTNPGANQQGSWTAIGGATSADWSGFRLYSSIASAGGTRFLVELSFDGGSTIALPEIPCSNTTTGVALDFDIPLQVPSGTTISARIRGSAAGNIDLALKGYLAGSGNPPGFTTATAILAANTANTSASSTTVTTINDATTFSALATTGADFGAFLLTASATTTPAGPLPVVMRLAADGVTIDGAQVITSNANPGAATLRLTTYKELPSGTALTLNLQRDTGAGASTVQINLVGFSGT